MAGQNDLFAGIITAFVMVVIGMSFLSSTADTISTTTDTYSATAEFALVNASETLLVTAGNNLTSVTSVIGTGLTCNVTTHWVAAANDSIILANVAPCIDDTYNVTYVYQTNSYIEDASTRAVIAIIVIFFALAIALGVLGEIPVMDMFGKK